MKIYLASPYGFAEATKPFLDSLKSTLRSAGYTVLDPWERTASMTLKPNEVRGSGSSSASVWRRMNRRLATSNKEAIEESDAIVAALDGPDVDSGTASEIGYAVAKAKPVVGYRGDTRRTGENEGTVVNVQVQYWIESSGGGVARSIPRLLHILEQVKKSLDNRSTATK